MRCADELQKSGGLYAVLQSVTAAPSLDKNLEGS
jgi:hypothetical protein